jgi:hypothetical protein
MAAWCKQGTYELDDIKNHVVYVQSFNQMSILLQRDSRADNLPRSGLLEPLCSRDGEDHAARDAGVRFL